MSHSYIAALVASVTTKREAIRIARAEANAIIAQRERQARGYDRGLFRDDDTLRRETIRQTIAFSVNVAFALSHKFSN